jgi:outer membrane protein
MRQVTTSLLALAIAAPLALSPASAADIGSYKDGGAPEDEWAVSGFKLGGILVIQPKYEGSNEYEALGFPYILPIFAGGGGSGFFSRFEAKGIDDVRFKLLERDGFVAGPLGGYSFGREDNDGDLLRGLGDIDGGIVLGGFVGYHLGPVFFDVSYHHFFDDSSGNQIRFGAEIERPLNERVTFTGGIGATYADGNYMQDYFGITTGQAISSPNFSSAYDADAGFKDVNITLGLKAELDERWTARASVRYSHLLGDAADSPIVESEDQFTGLIGLSYKFYSDR